MQLKKPKPEIFNFSLQDKALLQVISSLAGLALLLSLVLVIAPRPKIPEIYEVGPAGEQAYFQLKTKTVVVPQNADILVKILLDTCGGPACAELTAADVEIFFDNHLVPTRPDGSGPTDQAQEGNIFQNYFKNEITSVSPTQYRLYIAAYNEPPVTFNSSGKSEEEKVFAQIRLKTNAAVPNTTAALTIQENGTTTDWTNIYMKDFSGDITNQSLAPDNGNLTLQFADAHPAKLLLQNIANPASNVVDVTTGQPFEVNLNVEFYPEGIKTSGFDAIIDFNPAYMTVDKLDVYANSFYSNVPLQEFDNNTGTIKIGAFSAPEPGLSQSATLAKITFTAQNIGQNIPLWIKFNGPAVTTDSNVSFYSEAVLLTSPIDLLGEVGNLFLNILSPATPTSTPKPTATPIPSPTATPTPEPTSMPTPTPTPTSTPTPTPEPTATPTSTPTPTSILTSTPTPTPTSPPIACHFNADLNSDGWVDSTDLSIMVSYWGTNPPGDPCPDPDLNNDGIVNSIDIQIFIPWWKTQS